mmetsp:Transcript_106960/g.300817  ORF Transcript_106960/g.300817 Transcript_106960/m.300817 type:complete len:277 (+) Transcript_106960:1038-1868(+)
MRAPAPVAYVTEQNRKSSSGGKTKSNAGCANVMSHAWRMQSALMAMDFIEKQYHKIKASPITRRITPKTSLNLNVSKPSIQAGIAVQSGSTPADAADAIACMRAACTAPRVPRAAPERPASMVSSPPPPNENFDSSRGAKRTSAPVPKKHKLPKMNAKCANVSAKERSSKTHKRPERQPATARSFRMWGAALSFAKCAKTLTIKSDQRPLPWASRLSKALWPKSLGKQNCWNRREGTATTGLSRCFATLTSVTPPSKFLLSLSSITGAPFGQRIIS